MRYSSSHKVMVSSCHSSKMAWVAFYRANSSGVRVGAGDNASKVAISRQKSSPVALRVVPRNRLLVSTRR